MTTISQVRKQKLLDLTQLSLHIKSCGCRRTPGTSWKRLPGRPRKTRTSPIPDDTYWNVIARLL